MSISSLWYLFFPYYPTVVRERSDTPALVHKPIPVSSQHSGDYRDQNAGYDPFDAHFAEHTLRANNYDGVGTTSITPSNAAAGAALAAGENHEPAAAPPELVPGGAMPAPGQNSGTATVTKGVPLDPEHVFPEERRSQPAPRVQEHVPGIINRQHEEESVDLANVHDKRRVAPSDEIDSDRKMSAGEGRDEGGVGMIRREEGQHEPGGGAMEAGRYEAGVAGAAGGDEVVGRNNVRARGEKEHLPFGPIPVNVMLPTFTFYVFAGTLVGFWFTRTRPERRKYGRTNIELWYIIVHNLGIVFLSMLAWAQGSKELALITFSLEVSYEVFDSILLYRRFGKLDHETLLHHVGAPLCILFSTQTTIDVRILCHLMICIDLSGALLAFAKLLMRTGKWNLRRVYRCLFFMYVPLRIIGPYFDTVLILHNLFLVPGNMRTWTQFYFMSFMTINGLNLYFAVVIWKKGHVYTDDYLKNSED